MRQLAATAAVIIAASCGGSTEADGSGSGGSGGSGGASADCKTLEARVTEALDLAQVCDPSLDEPSCGLIVEGRCCKEAVNPDNAKAISDYQAALAEAKAAGCFTELCKTLKCVDPNTGNCIALPVGTSGACTPVL